MPSKPKKSKKPTTKPPIRELLPSYVPTPEEKVYEIMRQREANARYGDTVGVLDLFEVLTDEFLEPPPKRHVEVVSQEKMARLQRERAFYDAAKPKPSRVRKPPPPVAYSRSWSRSFCDADETNAEICSSDPKTTIAHRPKRPRCTAVRPCYGELDDNLDGIMYLTFPQRRDMIAALNSIRNARRSPEDRDQYVGWCAFTVENLRTLVAKRRLWDSFEPPAKEAEILSLRARESGRSNPFSREHIFFSDRLPTLDVKKSVEMLSAKRLDENLTKTPGRAGIRRYSMAYLPALDHKPKHPQRTLVCVVKLEKGGRQVRFAEMPDAVTAHQMASDSGKIALETGISWTVWYPTFGENQRRLDDDTVEAEERWRQFETRKTKKTGPKTRA